MKRTLSQVSQFNRTLKHTPLLVLVLAVILLSVSLCTTSNPVETSIMERIDLVFEGDVNMQAFLQSPQGDNGNDLIQLAEYGVPANRLDIAMDLGSGYTFHLMLINETASGLDELINDAYNIYQAEEMEDKQQYLLAELRYGSESAKYVANLGAHMPPLTNINALEIDCNDAVQLHGRLKDVVLYKNTEPDKSIILNGTFAAALNFGGDLIVIK
ncbi:MAG: hypothetical protein GY751_13170 [Bacteroidetes bacterium]|nr:hypothetical protein [Bacteroidota bacterium]